MAFRQEETYRPASYNQGPYRQEQGWMDRGRQENGGTFGQGWDRAMTDRERPLFGRRRFVETKSALKTTELLALVAGVAGILIAASQTEELNSWRAWLLITILGAAYMISRGLAKAGKGNWQDD